MNYRFGQVVKAWLGQADEPQGLADGEQRQSSLEPIVIWRTN
ncbi:hypothetical protein Q4503_16410 [Colwellia sp. 6_MG-2023]|nr:hypothetical protein [Colwellia sp. 6_MG-2023]MDO6489279.1 hypothetical protein [Colwellia sp. 6_MG-2023]